MTAKQTMYCSFCGKSQREAEKLIAVPDRVFICNECVGRRVRVIEADDGVVFDCSADAVLRRLKLRLSITQDQVLAKHLGVNKRTCATWRSRNSVPYAHIVRACVEGGIDIDWVLAGRPSPWTQGKVAP